MLLLAHLLPWPAIPQEASLGRNEPLHDRTRFHVITQELLNMLSIPQASVTSRLLPEGLTKTLRFSPLNSRSLYTLDAYGPLCNSLNDAYPNVLTSNETFELGLS